MLSIWNQIERSFWIISKLRSEHTFFLRDDCQFPFPFDITKITGGNNRILGYFTEILASIQFTNFHNGDRDSWWWNWSRNRFRYLQHYQPLSKDTCSVLESRLICQLPIRFIVHQMNRLSDDRGVKLTRTSYFVTISQSARRHVWMQFVIASPTGPLLELIIEFLIEILTMDLYKSTNKFLIFS